MGGEKKEGEKNTKEQTASGKAGALGVRKRKEETGKGKEALRVSLRKEEEKDKM